MMSFCSFWIVAIISPRTAFLFWERYLFRSSSFETTSLSKKESRVSSLIS